VTEPESEKKGDDGRDQSDVKPTCFKRLCFIVTALAVGLLICEAFLQIACLLSSRIDSVISPVPISRVVDDSLLDYRGNPDLPEHDDRGFRNTHRPDRVDIVALGDSNTYAHGVSREESWPQQLQKLSSRSTYNMGIGGFGPWEYHQLLDEAIELNPKRIIIGFYSGNDLMNAYFATYISGKASRFASTDQAVLDRLKTAEQGAAWKGRGNRRSRGGASTSFMSRHVQLYRLARTCYRNLKSSRSKRNRKKLLSWEYYKRIASQKNPGDRYAFESKGLRTVLTPNHRLTGVNLSNPRVSEGLRVTLDWFGRINQRRPPDCQVIILFIPIKESVYWPLAHDHQAIPAQWQIVVDAEAELRARTMAYLDEQGIAYIDALPALQQSLRDGKAPYCIDSDGHPNAVGHKVIAKLLASRLPERSSD